MEPLISVIIPVYNAEGTLHRCLDSVCGQSYNNLDIIIINDGSTDGSRVICDSYARRDRRIRVGHQEHSGVSATRNKGIDLAAGSYLTFVDSDDWIEHELYQHLIDVIRKEDYDIIQWPYYVDSAEGQCLLTRNPKEGPLQGYDCKNIAVFFSSVGYVWNKIYKAEAIHISLTQFDENAALLEDMLFILELLSGGYDINYIDYIGTHYVQYASSLGRKRTPANYALGVLCLERKLSFLRRFEIDENEKEKYRDRELIDLSYNELKVKGTDCFPNESTIEMIKNKLCIVSVLRLDKKRILKYCIIRFMLVLSRFRRKKC